MKCQLDPQAYQAMLRFLNSLHLTDGVGQARDLGFFREDAWLADTAVIEHLQRRRGAWEICLLFAHYRQPLRFIARRISSHACPRKAALTAMLMRRLAAKDQRGTLALRIEDLRIDLN
jgi:hypothetical protein